MTYEEGVKYMIQLCTEQKEKGLGPLSFNVGELLIEYPGFKPNVGDYRLSKNGTVYTHEQVVRGIFNSTTSENANETIQALEDLYRYGLTCQNPFFNQRRKELIYWITLQEDINYPPSAGYSGRKLAYQRFYEAILARLGYTNIEDVVQRTRSRFVSRPQLLAITGITHPEFYR